MTKLRRFGLSKCCWGAGPQGIVVCVKYTLFKYDLQSTDSRHEVHFFLNCYHLDLGRTVTLYVSPPVRLKTCWEYTDNSTQENYPLSISPLKS